MKFFRNKYNLLVYILLFSGLGQFSHLFLTTYNDIPGQYQLNLISFESILFSILLFNIIGLVLFYVNNKISSADPSFLKNKKKAGAYFFIIGLLLLVFNYLILCGIKWIVGLPDPFIPKIPGIRIVITIWLVELVIVSLIIINSFYRHLITLQNKTIELEESSAKAKFQALQNQLNPHFLFNNLNALISEIEYNPKNASLFTRHLSEVYRYILQYNEQQTISLQSELNFLESYLFLHHVRLGNCIHFFNHVDASLWEMKVPPLTLQLLVENVIKHNAISLTKPMVIDMVFHDKDMSLLVVNEIRERKGTISSGKGLQNLSERYKLLSNKDITIKKENNCFTVIVPLLDE